MIRMAIAYLAVFGALTGLMALLRAPINHPAIVLLPLMIWPDITLLTGLGKMSNRAAWICRIVGMVSFMSLFISRFGG